MIRLGTLICCVLTASCAIERIGDELGGPDTIALEQHCIDEYRDKFSRYEVSRGGLAEFARAEITPAKTTQRIATIGDLKLELVLGERRAVPPKNRLRTASRYRLLDAQNKVVASAESTLAIRDVRDGERYSSVVCVSDEEASMVLISEEQSWSVHRSILMIREPAGTWAVRYVRWPERGSPFPPPVQPKILGLNDRGVFLEQDGRVYAFPLRVLREDDGLEFSIG